MVEGRLRISDGTDDNFINEVKNVKEQGLTQQIKDAITEAERTGRRFRLFTPPEVKLTKDLQKLIDDREIDHVTFNDKSNDVENVNDTEN